MDNLLIETIDSYNDYLNKIPLGCQHIADLLRSDNIMIAMESISNFSEGVIWLISANELFRRNNVKSELFTTKIHEFLNETNIGLEIQDYVLVADMFEYEIKPFFKECKTIELEINNEF